MRWEDSWHRKYQSRITNSIRNSITRDGTTDCGYRGFRRECVQDLIRFEGMHRFLPCLVQLGGYSFGRVSVNDRRRHSGRSDYRFWSRRCTSLSDLIGVRWIISRTIDYRIRDEW